MVRSIDHLHMTIAVDWDVKLQIEHIFMYSNFLAGLVLNFALRFHQSLHRLEKYLNRGLSLKVLKN